MFGFTEASKFLLRSLSTGDEGLRACTYIPLAEVKAFLSCKSGGFFFCVFQASGGKHEARVTRDGRGTPLVARDSRSALASCLPPLALT